MDQRVENQLPCPRGQTGRAVPSWAVPLPRQVMVSAGGRCLGSRSLCCARGSLGSQSSPFLGPGCQQDRHQAKKLPWTLLPLPSPQLIVFPAHWLIPLPVPVSSSDQELEKGLGHVARDVSVTAQGTSKGQSCGFGCQVLSGRCKYKHSLPVELGVTLALGLGRKIAFVGDLDESLFITLG